jgi:hypothetical protein
MSKARDLANAGTALTTVSATELGYLDGVTSAVQTQVDGKEPTLPSQTGNSGKYLTTDGTDKSWETVSQYALPSQTGNAGKVLGTNGTSESWVSVTPDYSASSFFQKISYQNTDDSPASGSSTNISDSISNIVKDSDGNFYIAGNTNVGSIPQSSVFLMKKNSSGTTLWQKIYTSNTTSSSNGFDINRMHMDPSGNIIMVGNGWNGTSNSYAYNTVLVKASKTDGSIVWQKYAVSQGEYLSTKSSHVDSSGNIYVSLGYYIGSTGYGVLQKWDNNGAFQWVRRCSPPVSGYPVDVNDITTDSSGNVYTVGSTYDNTYGYSLHVSKFDSSGSNAWSYLYNTSSTNGENGYRITSDPSGNLYIGASTPSYASTFIKIDTNGTIQWSKYFGKSGAAEVKYNSDGNIYFLGSQNVSFGSNSYDAALVGKFDSSGTLLSQFAISAHPRQSTSLRDIIEDTNHFYLVGNIPNQTNSDGLLVKVKKDLSEFGQYTFNGALLNFKNQNAATGNGQTLTRYSAPGWGAPSNPSNGTNTYVIVADGIMASTNLYI